MMKACGQRDQWWWSCPSVMKTPYISPTPSSTLTRAFECRKRFRQISEAMQRKLPHTNTSMYCRVTGDKPCELRPRYTPKREIKFTKPLLITVSRSLKWLFSRMATSPISRGISWAMMPTVTGRNWLGLPRLKATPMARPSMKLWRRELMRLRKPVAYLGRSPFPRCCSRSRFSFTWSFCSSSSSCQCEWAMPLFSISLSKRTKEMMATMKVSVIFQTESCLDEQASGRMCMASPSNAPQEKANSTWMMTVKLAMERTRRRPSRSTAAMKPMRETNPPATIPQKKRSRSLHRSLVASSAIEGVLAARATAATASSAISLQFIIILTRDGLKRRLDQRYSMISWKLMGNTSLQRPSMFFPPRITTSSSRDAISRWEWRQEGLSPLIASQLIVRRFNALSVFSTHGRISSFRPPWMNRYSRTRTQSKFFRASGGRPLTAGSKTSMLGLPAVRMQRRLLSSTLASSPPKIQMPSCLICSRSASEQTGGSSSQRLYFFRGKNTGIILCLAKPSRSFSATLAMVSSNQNFLWMWKAENLSSSRFLRSTPYDQVLPVQALGVEAARSHHCFIISLRPSPLAQQVDVGDRVSDQGLAHYEETAAAKEKNLGWPHYSALALTKGLESFHHSLLHPAVLGSVVVAERGRLSAGKEVGTTVDDHAHGIEVNVWLPGEAVVLVDGVVDVELEADSGSHLFTATLGLLDLLFHWQRLQFRKPVHGCLPFGPSLVLAVLLDTGVLLLIEEDLRLYGLADVGRRRPHALQRRQDLVHAGCIYAAERGKPLHVLLEVDQRTRWLPLLGSPTAQIRRQPLPELTPACLQVRLTRKQLRLRNQRGQTGRALHNKYNAQPIRQGEKQSNDMNNAMRP